MGHQPKLGSYGKNWIFGQKNEIFGPKKGIHFWGFTMFWPQPEKVVQRKKSAFAQIIKGGNVILGDFLG